MAWQYNDWQQQPSSEAKLERLRLHHGEVAAKIDAEVSFEGTSRSTNNLTQYLDRVERNIERLEAIVGENVQEIGVIRTDFGGGGRF